MSEPTVETFKIKTLKSDLAKNIQVVLPLIEEITNIKLLPIALIGLKVKEDGETQIYVATVSDDNSTESAIKEIMKMLAKSTKTK